VLLNLVGNGVKFTEHGEVVVRVQAQFHSYAKMVLRFEVADTGIGLAAEDIKKLFQPFVQGETPSPNNYGGTGLGLAICKRLSEMMGGGIWVESELGKGSTFHFTILARAAAGSSLPAWQSPQPRPTPP